MRVERHPLLLGDYNDIEMVKIGGEGVNLWIHPTLKFACTLTTMGFSKVVGFSVHDLCINFVEPEDISELRELMHGIWSRERQLSMRHFMSQIKKIDNK